MENSNKKQNIIGKKKPKEAKLSINDIPFVPNVHGKTPLHISISKNNTRFTDKIVTVLADTDLDHHSRFISNQLHKLVD